MRSMTEPGSLALQHVNPPFRQVMIFLAALAPLLALLAGCTGGGSSFPGGYHCTAPQNPVGCATEITFSHSHINPDSNPDIPGNPNGAYSDVLVVPLTCDAACQASSGTSTKAFIYNYLSLVQLTGDYYLVAGYITTPTGMQYFTQYALPDVNNGQYTYVNLGPAPTGNGGPNVDYKYATISLVYLPGNGGWNAVVVPAYGPPGLLGQATGSSSFQPDFAHYGQFIFGTSGATGLTAFFAGNQIGTPPDPPYFGNYLTEDGSPPSVIQTVDHPTDAYWFIPASKSSTGGMFAVACC